MNKCDKIRYLLIIMLLPAFFTSGCAQDVNEQLTDADGNVYTTVKIGDQTWMVENLRTSKLSDGTIIPAIAGDNEWSSLTSPGYCWYENDAGNKEAYGGLYNWFTVETGKICPVGWHVPSREEYEDLVVALGGNDLTGGAMKEQGTLHWSSPNVGATNISGFTALPGGDRSGAAFYNMNYYGEYWTSTAQSTEEAYFILLVNDSNYILFDYFLKKAGFSVRCLKDRE